MIAGPQKDEGDDRRRQPGGERKEEDALIESDAAPRLRDATQLAWRKIRPLNGHSRDLTL